MCNFLLHVDPDKPNPVAKKISNARRAYSPADLLALTTQVDGQCPLCGASLFYRKKGRGQKAYELAHIYPLNPAEDEIQELMAEHRLHEDVNHPDNLMPLCLSCHGKFDKPRTKEEYQALVSKKLAMLRREEQRRIQQDYHLEGDIAQIISSLYDDQSLAAAILEYNPKRLSEKLNATMSLPTQHKVRHNVSDYYQFVRDKFLDLERQNPTASELIYAQVKTYYLKQKSLALSQQDIFANMVQWLMVKTDPETVEAAEIVTSFFIQNCEVFE